MGYFEGCFGSLSYLRNKNEKCKSPMIAYPLSYLQRSGHVVEWLYEGLQILLFKQFYLPSHSKVPIKEFIILQFNLQVISWAIPGPFWVGS